MLTCHIWKDPLAGIREFPEGTSVIASGEAGREFEERKLPMCPASEDKGIIASQHQQQCLVFTFP